MTVSAFPYGCIARPQVAVVSLSGETITHSVANGNTATASLLVSNDARIYKTEGGTFTQIDVATDWVRPVSANDGLYEVMFTKGVFDATPSGSALNVWLTLDVDRTVTYSHSTNDTELGGTITAAIRYNGGATLDSASYPMSAIVGLPP